MENTESRNGNGTRTGTGTSEFQKKLEMF